jgi:hypothetical protein
MFYPARPSSCLTPDGELDAKNCQESSAFLQLTSAPHTDAVGFSRFLGISRAIASHMYDYGVTHGLADWLPVPLAP